MDRVRFVIVIRVEVKRESDLVLIIDAFRAQCGRFGARKRWQQHARKDRNDRDDHQQFDQCEGRGTISLVGQIIGIGWFHHRIIGD
jgi:hypothetical protein